MGPETTGTTKPTRSIMSPEKRALRKERRKQRKAGIKGLTSQTDKWAEVEPILTLVYPNYKRSDPRKIEKMIRSIKELIFETPGVDHLNVAKLMDAWCIDNDKEPGLLRYRKFIENSVRFKAERNQGNVGRDQWEREMEATKERIKDLS